ncbi:MAG: OmpH family outer membrane protein [Desulfomonile tiedjei]|uniref:OmpH family outer membrane protein n=1 Tax=Desulfomonile tiedjei TaxID=2358 RepID=A0A9D6Z5V2_9BACT|nr:OmpH family outer membrane protein [Desulfomonile tiedjei]
MKDQRCLGTAIIFALVVLGTTIFVGAGFAADLKIAKINLAAVTENSTRVKNAMEEIKKIQMESAPKLTVLSGDIKKIEEELKAGEASLSKENKEKLENEINTKKQEIQQEQQSVRVKVAFKQKSVSNVIRTQLKETLEKLAKDGGYSVIMNSDVILYSDGVPDVTEQVTKALDAMPAMENVPKQ